MPITNSLNAFDINDAYWQVSGDLDAYWSSARFTYVGLDDADYQAWLLAGGMFIRITDTSSLNHVMVTQRLPWFFRSGLAVEYVNNRALNTTFSLDEITLEQIGTVARDSACGLGFPQGLSVFIYPDINSLPVAFTPAELQGLYVAIRDYIAEVNFAVAQLIHKQPAEFPVQPVLIP